MGWQYSGTLRRLAWGAAAAAMLGQSGSSFGFSFEIGEVPVRIDNLVTIGATWRMQKRDDTLIGKSSLTPGLCISRLSGAPDAGANPRNADGSNNGNIFSGNTCNPAEDDASGQFADANRFFVAAPGSFNPNGDNGNLNFDRHDLVQATGKLTSDINLELFGFNFFARALYFFDNVYNNFEETRPDTTFQPARVDYARAGRNQNGNDFQFLDYFVSRTFEIGDRQLAVKVGNQVLNWGESGFLALNSINSINAPNQVLLRFPGSDLKEVFQPQGMVKLDIDIFEGAGLELFYQYEWKPIIADPVGSFFSSSDTVGAGGTYAMLAFGKVPDDPTGIYQPYQNPGDPAAILGSTSSRTAQRDLAIERAPSNGGQYGAALRYFFENLNNGTEVGVYYANYHSRVPSVSAYAADATCLGRGGTLVGGVGGLLDAVGGLLGPLGQVTGLVGNVAKVVAECEVPLTNLTAALGVGNFSPAGREGLPLDSMRLFVEYPEDIHLFGASFNTTLGDVAWSGEYAFRSNLPIQIHTTDIVFAALQPAFPADDFSLEPIATLPARRTAVPDFISQYRGIEIQPGDYIRGYERMKIGQLGTTFLKTIGGDNLFNASQITLLLELGMTHVIDMPGLDQLQFNGAGTDTHISGGADGSLGINPIDVRIDPSDVTSNRGIESLRQNPVAHVDLRGFGTDLSYGYRLVTLTRYDNAFLGINLEFLNALFHDVKGTAPGLGQNFVEGRKQILSGIRWDYLSRYTGEIRYTWFTGGAHRDQNRDRDNLLVYVGYQF